MKKFVLLACLFIQINVILCASQTSRTSADFDKLVDETFDSSYKFHPSSATADGFHQYDTQLEDFSGATIDSEVADLKRILVKLQAFPRADLSETSTSDLEFLISR